jgi:hypothetical protein
MIHDCTGLNSTVRKRSPVAKLDRHCEITNHSLFIRYSSYGQEPFTSIIYIGFHCPLGSAQLLLALFLALAEAAINNKSPQRGCISGEKRAL